MNLDAFFLEYDDDRSGDFKPLRFLPKGKTVVLGLVTTKFGQMEKEGRPQAAHRRGRKYAPLDQLALSARSAASPAPVHGNNIAVEDAAQQAAGWW
jgi:5-methyltetrahydropteroyltriglutamate--homocysteine methyltransferase